MKSVGVFADFLSSIWSLELIKTGQGTGFGQAKEAIIPFMKMSLSVRVAASRCVRKPFTTRDKGLLKSEKNKDTSLYFCWEIGASLE